MHARRWVAHLGGQRLTSQATAPRARAGCCTDSCPPRPRPPSCAFPAKPSRPVRVINGHVIDKTSPGAFDKGYLLLIRDRSGEIIERQREQGEP